MALEDFCLVAGVVFVLIYLVTVAAAVSIIIEQRKRKLAMHRIRYHSRRRSL